MEKLQQTLEEEFGSFERAIVNVGKKVAAMNREMKVILGLVILVAMAVPTIFLIITWQHFGFLCTPCISTCKFCSKCLAKCGCKGLGFCCKGLSSCCKGGSSADSEAQKQPDLEAQKQPNSEAQNQPRAEMK